MQLSNDIKYNHNDNLQDNMVVIGGNILEGSVYSKFCCNTLFLSAKKYSIIFMLIKMNDSSV